MQLCKYLGYSFLNGIRCMSRHVACTRRQVAASSQSSHERIRLLAREPSFEEKCASPVASRMSRSLLSRAKLDREGALQSSFDSIETNQSEGMNENAIQDDVPSDASPPRPLTHSASKHQRRPTRCFPRACTCQLNTLCEPTSGHKRIQTRRLRLSTVSP